VLDELHALVTSKRGDLLSLGLARLRMLAPQMQRRGPVGHGGASRTDLRLDLPAVPAGTPMLRPVTVGRRQAADRHPRIRAERLPWAGHVGRPCPVRASTRRSKRHKLTLVFVNTRMQAELLFQALWSVNEDTLPIALHHGSLDVGSAARSRRRWRRAN
jgi:ATP-dependent Lhr-like helicase